MKNCIHCKAPNPEEWFTCRKCGKRASDVKFTTNMYMMSEIGKRTDIEFRTMTVEEDIKDMNRRRYASGW
jgi:uncharacterized membrane protein YvbJ